ncbi:MAG: MFS transporter [Ilumatobacteraceae bacterium]
MVIGRLLDDSFVGEIKRNITIVTIARLVANACYRFAPPFLAIIVTDLDVTLSQAGFAIFLSELTGLLSPMVGRLTERVSHRASMVIGLVGTGVGCAIAAVAPSLTWFAIGITVLVFTKQAFDIGLGAWIADHVPYAQRGRITGLTEMSWALGLLVGVSVLGVVTALASWRVAYLVAVAMVVVLTIGIARRVTDESKVRVHHERSGAAIRGRGWLVVLAMFCIMSAAQNLFVTFGSWLSDDFGFDAAGLTVVGFALGAVELLSSTGSASRTDRWGKERSIALGAFLIVPGGILLAAGADALFVGLLGIAIYLLGFEFSVVSLLPVASTIVPNNPAVGFGWVLGAGALGRALMSLVSTRVYEDHGIRVAALLGPVLALVAVALILQHGRLADNEISAAK